MRVSFSPPDMTEEEVREVREAILSGWITTGPKTKEFERQIANYCGVNKAVCLNSQTACAEMALHILGIGVGDEVIVPAYTCDGVHIEANSTITASTLVPAGTKVKCGEVFDRKTMDINDFFSIPKSGQKE